SFVGWYTTPSFDELYNFNASVIENITLYARWILNTTVDLTQIKTDALYSLNEYAQEKIEQFDEVLDNEIILAINADVNAFTTKINACENEADIQYQLAQAKDAINELVKDYYANKGDEGTIDSIILVQSAGNLETAYVEWLPVQSATSYNVYYKAKDDLDSKYVKIDMMLIRSYGSYYRADVLGLKAGDYTIKVVPIINANEASFNATTNVTVLAHDRSGYAFVNGSSSGGYNDDGTPKSNAVIIYITEKSKDSVSLDITTNNKGSITNYVGLNNILLGFKKGYDKRPLIVRFIGNITDLATMNKGDICIDDCQNGITFEGVGNDATANGWGIRIKNSSNVEIRNLAVMNVDSNEGDNIGLQQDNDHVWIHNNDIFYGHAGSDSDQAKGDGALDTKTSSYITHSYNHFWDCGKCNLQGMKSESTENYITYHHNWYDHSDSRHPRIRTCTVHIYNNFYDGNSKYGVGVTMGASAFVENNYFRNCKNPMLSSLQGTDALGEGTFSGEAGGIIKAYGNYIEGGNPMITYADNNTSFDCYVVSSRYETIPASVVTLVGGTSYNNFDSAGSFYTYKVDTPEEAVANIKLYCGRVQGGDFKWTFNNSVDDESYDVNPALKAALISYETKLIKILGEN
ncbi:MAG: hypothetical protein J6R47_01405, partial [Acholeplasmatales bacterium]|nr:hypothetical protein [Acholeplasmatales bacterium]